MRSRTAASLRPCGIELTAYPGKVVLIRRPDRRVGGAVIRAEVREAAGRCGSPRSRLARAPRRCRPPRRRGDRRTRVSRLHPRPPRRMLRAPRRSALRGARAGTSRPSGSGRRRISAATDSRPTSSCSRTASSWAASRSTGLEEVVDIVTAGRIPLDLYRGRTLYSPRVQAAEIAARAATGWDEVDGLTLAADDGESGHVQHAARRRDGARRGARRARCAGELRGRARADRSPGSHR